jgi:hypothetical protein
MVMRHELKAEYIVCGVVIDQSYEGPCISVAKCEIQDDEERYTNCIEIQYGVSVESGDIPLGQSDINRIIMEEVEPLPQCLSLLLAHPSHLLNYETRLDGKSVELESPARDAPLGLYGLATRLNWRPSAEIQRYSSQVDKDSWPILEDLMSEYRQRPVTVRRQLTIPLRWFAKASSEMSGLDRLVAYWISFNSLWHDPNRPEQEVMKEYLRAQLDISIAQRYVHDNDGILFLLSSLRVTGGRTKSVMIAQELDGLLKAAPRDCKSIVEKAMLVIYAIRNNLFHGDYNPASDDDRRHVDVAQHLLSPLLKEIIACQILGHPLPTTRFASGGNRGTSRSKPLSSLS